MAFSSKMISRALLFLVVFFQASETASAMYCQSISSSKTYTSCPQAYHAASYKYCCYTSANTLYCCNLSNYIFQTTGILAGLIVAIIVVVLTVVCFCCCCCGCCPFAKRRQRGLILQGPISPVSAMQPNIYSGQNINAHGQPNYPLYGVPSGPAEQLPFNPDYSSVRR